MLHLALAPSGFVTVGEAGKEGKDFPGRKEGRDLPMINMHPLLLILASRRHGVLGTAVWDLPNQSKATMQSRFCSFGSLFKNNLRETPPKLPHW